MNGPRAHSMCVVASCVLALSARADGGIRGSDFTEALTFAETTCPAADGTATSLRVVLVRHTAGNPRDPAAVSLAPAQAIMALVAESARGRRVLWAESYLSVADSDSTRHLDVECSDSPPGSVLLADILSGRHALLASVSVATITDVGIDLRALTDEAGAYLPVLATGEVLTIKRVVTPRRGRITGVRSALADDGLAVLIESQSPGVPVVLWFDIPTRTWVHDGTIAEPGPPPAPKEALPSAPRP